MMVVRRQQTWWLQQQAWSSEHELKAESKEK